MPSPIRWSTTQKEQMDEISKLTVDIYKYVEESWANWIVNGGIENDWDGYIAQLNQMGLERLMEIYQGSSRFLQQRQLTNCAFNYTCYRYDSMTEPGSLFPGSRFNRKIRQQ